MNNWHDKATDDFCDGLLTLKTREEIYAFLEDVCTIKEILDISQRLQVAMQIDKGVGYTAISQETGVSTATISRVSKCYEYGSGGYKTVIERLRTEKKHDR